MPCSLEKINFGVYVVGGMFLAAQGLVGIIRKFIPAARLEFEPDGKILETIKQLQKPADNRCAREEFGWVSQYPVESTIQDFIREWRGNPEG